MRTRTLAVWICLALLPTLASAQNWPQFRGAGASGIADGQNLPTSWNPDTGENIRWKTEIPGLGHSSPVVWGDRVYVTTAVSANDLGLVLGDEGGIDLADDETTFSWRILALDRATGEIVWDREAYQGAARATRHVKASQVNSTPATDGDVIVAIFGSQGLKAFDANGKELWSHDLGVLDPGLFGDASSQWGHSSSPVIHDGRVYVQVDRHADSFLAAYELRTGAKVWRIDRDEKPIWATPTIDVTGDRAQLIVLGGTYDRGLDPATGEELWRLERDFEVKTPTPVVAGDQIIITGGYRAVPLVSVPVDAEGTVGEPRWTSEKGGPYTGTPVVVGERIYFARNTGVLTVVDLVTGEFLSRRRIGGNYSASPVASDGKVYFPSEEGVVTVVDATAEPETLAKVDMGESLMASPAIASETLFLRGTKHLFAIGRTEAAGAQADSPRQGS